ncbi:MAG: UDP-N-acetylmuramoyl-L-alanine--D-glutamate ligase [Gammaproteobacteria bacterium]
MSMPAVRDNDQMHGAGSPPAVPEPGLTLVLGMGGTGVSCARFLASRGQRAIFADTRRVPPGQAAIRAAMPDATLVSGEALAAVPADVVRILVSPGVDLKSAVLNDARQRGVPVLSDIDLFAAEATAPITAITGSNGKSTVTAMVGAMLANSTADQNLDVAVGGNLGTPALELLSPTVSHYVLELSSFQLERSAPVPVAASVVLNVTPDHLDVHGDMAHYQAAKARIYARCGVAIVNRDEPELAELVPVGTPVIGFGLEVPAPGDFGVITHDDSPWLAHGAEPLMPVAALSVTGRHNVSNAMAALALASVSVTDVRSLLPGLRGFKALPHRMALVARRGGVTFVDDSKATNVGAAVASIGSVDGPLVLIAGGDAKGASFETIAAALNGRECAAILLGRDRDLLAAALDPICPVHRVADMPSAVHLAAQLARPGWTVLLAPACSSLDMYTDYSARGRAFSDAVLALPLINTGAGDE